MPTKQLLAVFVAALFVISLGFAGANATSALQAQPTAVAVVDLQRVAESLAQRQQVVADLRSRRDELQQTAREKAKQVENLRGDLDLLQAGTPAYQQKQEELMKATLDLQVWQEFEARKLRLEEQVQTENLLRKVNDTVARVAEDNNYDVVLVKGQSINTGDNNQLNLRYVLWSNDEVEITDQIIQRMNNEFEAGQ